MLSLRRGLGREVSPCTQVPYASSHSPLDREVVVWISGFDQGRIGSCLIFRLGRSISYRPIHSNN